jgi:hypothetical protein
VEFLKTPSLTYILGGHIELNRLESRTNPDLTTIPMSTGSN